MTGKLFKSSHIKSAFLSVSYSLTNSMLDQQGSQRSRQLTILGSETSSHWCPLPGQLQPVAARSSADILEDTSNLEQAGPLWGQW